MGFLRTLGRALFLDVPYLIDSIWRRLDFRLNREFDYHLVPAEVGRLQPRPSWRRPLFWFFAITVVFVGYGPVWGGLCTVFVPPLATWALGAAGLVLFGLAVRLLFAMMRGAKRRLDSRFGSLAAEDDGLTSLPARRLIACAVLGVLMLGVLSLIGFAAYSLFAGAQADPAPCFKAEFSFLSLYRLLLCAAAIGVFGGACFYVQSTRALAAIQFVLLALVTGLLWFVLAPSDAREASRLPYRHVFALLAPALCLPLALAPFVAAAKFKSWAGFDPASGATFADLLPRRELFEARGGDPELTFDRVGYALVHGVLYRPLELLLPPSLLAFVARPSLLDGLVACGLVFSVFMLAWGSIANRWQQMVIIVERWFLRGMSLPVSLFVIAIAALRVFKVDYVTTIMDAAPFGALFGLVAMSYVMSWLIEYWLNRAVCVALLQVLGSSSDRAAMEDPLTIPLDPDIHVEREGRFLMSHAIGRFMVVGTMSNAPPGAPAPAFNSYDLLGFLTKLAGREDRYVAEVVRHANIYFYILNLLLLSVLGGFGCFYVVHNRTLAVDAVVETTAAAPASGLIDLAAQLVSDGGAKPKPALVVVASGGGTRAAVYTAHVLEGLHRLGVDQDIVLMSGVSGGGVALTFFAANYAQLAATGNADMAWEAFKRHVSDEFIRDVLEGATEWRIFGATPLTTLLAESFDRRLPQSRKTFADVSAAPPLILNTTIVGHPDHDSDVLRKTLDPVQPSATDRCAQEEEPYTLMKGGRLVFTNIKNTSEFPGRVSTVPDTRLPYRIVQGLDVRLANAAALHANFPPVFPSARVVFKDLTTGSCPKRSYFVTDGGAEENLGLVSALFAIKSALSEIAGKCAKDAPGTGEAKPGCALRPIHFVIIEASATGYDFTQDRGVSAATAGAKERVTGGLTEMLIGSTRAGGQEAQGVRFHYLALPLLFRSRGGFGTHWMQADEIEVADPRVRESPPWWRGLPGFGTGKVTLRKNEVASLWSALYRREKPFFCDEGELAEIKAKGSARSNPETVRQWICLDGQGGKGPRDLQVEQWESLVAELR